MGEKKQPGRFTLQFNLEDPQQRSVAETLEQQGRRKAQFITSAVLHYLQDQEPREHGGAPATLDETAMEQMLLAFLEKHPRFAETLSGESDSGGEVPARTAPGPKEWRDPSDDDTVRAISETLAAFQQK